MLARASRPIAVIALVFITIAVSAQTPQTADPSDLLPETQMPIRGRDYAGMVWWIPVEFWERAFIQQGATPEKAAEQVKPLREYVMVAVVIGKLGSFGAIAWSPADQVRAKTLLRDRKGVSYPPLAKVGPDAETLAAVLKPVLANALGKMGESIVILFFPAKGVSQQALADPLQKGSFAIVLQELAGKPESVFEWQLPLTAVSPPKYCPAGKERVNANWNFCPWHGVALNEPAKSVTPPAAGK